MKTLTMLFLTCSLLGCSEPEQKTGELRVLRTYVTNAYTTYNHFWTGKFTVYGLPTQHAETYHAVVSIDGGEARDVNVGEMNYDLFHVDKRYRCVYTDETFCSPFQIDTLETLP